MKIGKVTGSVWATKKDETLNGQKLLVLKLLESSEREKEGLIVASDIIGAGVGDLVLVSFGSVARYAVGSVNAPIDAAVIGIVDSIEVDGYE